MARLFRLIPDVDYKKLPLNPVEGTVFLKVNGQLAEPEIAKATGFHAETVQKALDRLVELGAIALVDKAKDQADRTVKLAAGLALGGNLGKGERYDAKLLAEDIELDVDKKKVILDAASRLEKLNFYELLGLHRLVDKKEVKAAYYAVAPEFHPDKFFKRKLGSYKGKIEAIFARLTLAHDTLSSAQRRAEYDEYLATLEQGRRAESLMDSSHDAIREAQALIEAEAKRAAEAAEKVQKEKDLTDRKRALAAKLGPRAAAKPSGPSAPSIPQMDPRAAAEALRVRYEYAKEQAAKAQLESSLEKGRLAAVQGDWAGAANLFRIAATLAPSNPDVQREANQVLTQAAVHLAETFAKLGEFELQQERWFEAAANLLKACAGRPEDARLHERAAYAAFKEGSNPKRAAELARRAVELSPKMPQFRVTLAYCYAAGGLAQSAKNELDRALEIAPKNEAVIELVSAGRELVAGLLSRASEKQATKPAEPSPPAPTTGLPAFLPPVALNAPPAGYPAPPQASPYAAQPGAYAQPSAGYPGAAAAASGYAAQAAQQAQPNFNSAPPQAQYAQPTSSYTQPQAQAAQYPGYAQSAYPAAQPYPAAQQPAGGQYSQPAYSQGQYPQGQYAQAYPQANQGFGAAPATQTQPQAPYNQAYPAQQAQGNYAQPGAPYTYRPGPYPAQPNAPTANAPAQSPQGYAASYGPGYAAPNAYAGMPQAHTQPPNLQQQPSPTFGPAPGASSPPPPAHSPATEPQEPAGVTGPMIPAKTNPPVGRPSGAYSVVPEPRKK